MVPASGKSQFACTLCITFLFCFALLPLASAQQNNTINTVVGGVPINSTATLAAISDPTGVAEDADGNLYIASSANYAVYKVNPNTNALTVFAGTGISGFSGDGGPATLATLSSPTAVGVDQNTGAVYIVDGNRIRVVSGGTISTFSGNGQGCSPNIDACGDGGPASSNQVSFSEPEGLYVDGSGNLFVSDTGDDRVRFINTQAISVTVTGITVPAGYIVTLAGNGLTCNGPTYTCGDGRPATQSGPSGARLDLAVGVVTDANGNLYIADTRDQRIRCVVNKAGGCPNTAYPNPVVGEIVTYAGSGIVCDNPTSNTNPCNDGQPPLSAQFRNPSGVWVVDSLGYLLIADQWDNKIRMVTTGAKAVVTTVCGTGAAGYGGDGGTCPNAVLDGPLGILLDKSNHAIILDSGNSRVRWAPVSTEVIETVAGGGSIGDGNAATLASLAAPAAVAWDSTGTNYYIADTANNRIREVAANGTITTVAGSGEPTEPSFPNGDGASATLANLQGPLGLALDANGNIYIADSSNSIVRLVNMQKTPIVVEKTITIQSGDIATVAGSGNTCEDVTKPCGDGGAATKAFISDPVSVALDGQNNLYLADYYDNRIRKVDLSTGIITTLAGTGNRGKSGDGGPATEALLNHPYGLAADSAGDVYIADSFNNEVRCVLAVAGGCGDTAQKYSPGTIITYAFNGAATYGGDGGPATTASMSVPKEVALDSAEDLFVGGGGDMLVRRVDAPSQTVITVAGDNKHPGAPGFAGDGGPATAATLDNLGLSVSPSQELLIADQGNNRIRQVDMVPTANLWEQKLVFPTTTVGQSSSPQAAKLQNAGLASLPISSVMESGDVADFPIVGNSPGMLACVPQLSPGPGTQQFCYVTVTFTPQQTGTRTATLTINTSLGARVVNLSGVGQ
jgi:trimeric autotransporter adhesin